MSYKKKKKILKARHIDTSYQEQIHTYKLITGKVKQIEALSCSP